MALADHVDGRGQAAIRVLDEPLPLPLTTPRFVHDLVASPKWRCMAGGMVLTTTPRTVEVGTGDKFLALLQDKQRECPIVYVSRRTDTGQPMVDPARLARAIVGAGVAFVAASNVRARYTAEHGVCLIRSATRHQRSRARGRSSQPRR